LNERQIVFILLDECLQVQVVLVPWAEQFHALVHGMP